MELHTTYPQSWHQRERKGGEEGGAGGGGGGGGRREKRLWYQSHHLLIWAPKSQCHQTGRQAFPASRGQLQSYNQGGRCPHCRLLPTLCVQQDNPKLYQRTKQDSNQIHQQSEGMKFGWAVLNNRQGWVGEGCCRKGGRGRGGGGRGGGGQEEEDFRR